MSINENMKKRKFDYSDGRTKQAFKDSTDIVKILAKAQQVGAISHLAKYEGTYGDFADFDFAEANVKMAQARSVFEELPSEVRREFHQEPSRFFEYVNDPENVGRLAELLPEIAEPGRFFPEVEQPRGRAPERLDAVAEEVVTTPPAGAAPPRPEGADDVGEVSSR